MIWHLCQTNKAWYKVVCDTMAWNAFKIVNFDIMPSHQTLSIQGLFKHCLKAHLQFEVKCLEFFL
jgi:hypothetical protein